MALPNYCIRQKRRCMSGVTAIVCTASRHSALAVLPRSTPSASCIPPVIELTAAKEFRCASSDEQRGDLGLCQTSDDAAIKPVPRHRKKGYAVDGRPVTYCRV